MNYEALIRRLHIQNPQPKVKEIFDAHRNELLACHILQFDLCELFNHLHLHQEIKMQLMNKMNQMDSLSEDAIALSFLVMITVQYAHPSERLLPEMPFENEKEQGLLLVLSLVLVASFQWMRFLKSAHGKDHAFFNFNHLKNYINRYYEEHHLVGTNHFNWCINLAAIGLIHIHTLHFMHHVFTEQCIVFQNKTNQTKTILALGGLKVRKDGQHNGINELTEEGFITSFLETDDFYQGCRVNPYGAITDKQISLSKKNYEVYLKPGDAVIDFHIPTGKGYDLINVRKSFEDALSFFRSVYQEHDYKAFWCDSWLSSPQIPLFLSNRSGNIFQINEQSYSFPSIHDQRSILKFVFHDENIDLHAINPKTSLERDIVDFNKKNQRINCGIFLLFVDDLHLFGSTPYRTKESFEEYVSMNLK